MRCPLLLGIVRRRRPTLCNGRATTVSKFPERMTSIDQSSRSRSLFDRVIHALGRFRFERSRSRRGECPEKRHAYHAILQVGGERGGLVYAAQRDAGQLTMPTTCISRAMRCCASRLVASIHWSRNCSRRRGGQAERRPCRCRAARWGGRRQEPQAGKGPAADRPAALVQRLMDRRRSTTVPLSDSAASAFMSRRRNRSAVLVPMPRSPPYRSDRSGERPGWCSPPPFNRLASPRSRFPVMALDPHRWPSGSRRRSRRSRRNFPGSANRRHDEIG